MGAGVQDVRQRVQRGTLAKDPVTGEFCFGWAGEDSDECADAVDASYLYLGWVFDRMDDEFGIVNADPFLTVLRAMPGVDPGLLPDTGAVGLRAAGADLERIIDGRRGRQ